MMKRDMNPLEKVYWEDMRDEVIKINPELSGIIDQISPDHRFPLIKATYAFGDYIVQNGVARLPSTNGETLPLTDDSFRHLLKDDLDYSPIPLFLLLKNTCEVFIDAFNKVIPLNLFYPGSLLGVFETLDFICGMPSSSEWFVTAGARNLFTLPKLHDASGFKRLKKTYNITVDMIPKHLTDHWKLFLQLSRHTDFPQEWKNQVFFFTKPWFSYFDKDKAWYTFKDYIIRVNYQQIKFALYKSMLSLGWQQFYELIASRNLKPTPYIIEHLKYILLIAAGAWPGIKASDDSNQVAPTESFQKILMDIYNLKSHYPAMMHITSLERESNISKYYSLSYPTIFEGISINKNASSTIMMDLQILKHLIHTIQPAFNKVNNGIFSKAQFDYFHVEKDKYDEIRLSSELQLLDENLLKEKSGFSDRAFCATSQFWRGCIRISSKN